MEKERLFYCTESGNLYTMEELRKMYLESEDTEYEFIHGLGFSEWLNHCMVENNGTLEEIKILYTIGNCIVWNIKTDL